VDRCGKYQYGCNDTVCATGLLMCVRPVPGREGRKGCSGQNRSFWQWCYVGRPEKVLWPCGEGPVARDPVTGGPALDETNRESPYQTW
jgi:hypothetical protein